MLSQHFHLNPNLCVHMQEKYFLAMNAYIYEKSTYREQDSYKTEIIDIKKIKHKDIILHYIKDILHHCKVIKTDKF